MHTASWQARFAPHHPHFVTTGADLKQHLWDKNYPPKTVATTGFLLQKLNYIRADSNQELHNAASKLEGYPWPGPHYCIRRERCIIPIDNVMTIIEECGLEWQWAPYGGSRDLLDLTIQLEQ